MTAMESQGSTGRLDARPMRPTGTDTPWDQAVAMRDRFAREMRRTLDGEGVDAAIFFSQNGAYPPWVKLEAWLPAAGADADALGRERAELEFVVDVKPYHEHEVVVGASMSRGKKKLAVSSRPEFPVHLVEGWTRHALGRGPKPANYTPVSDAVRNLIHGFLPFVPEAHRNRVLKDYRTRLSGAKIAAIASGLAVLFGAQIAAVTARYGPDPLMALLPLVGIAGLVATAIYVRFRQRAVSVTAQPLISPRALAPVDSWHVVAAELGRNYGLARNRLVTAIATDTGPGVICQAEVYTQRAPNGYEQRERLVISKDQGVVHVHIYQFGNDIFVGWNAYVNWAQWAETSPVSMKIRDGKEVEFRDLRPAVYVPSQFDLIDLSSLSELVHRRIERELKAMLREKAIDQEIDFKIIRGSRENALDQSKHGQEPGKKSSWNYKTSA